ncbi:DUF6985 domain-containing protein [Streptococcus oralis]|uniref:DUF6985 domain-containing protein n=1 Tax=Streptococcus oralis TaxID=1303 RepID=A0A4V0EJN7_STROR|nr:hypothetical protein [Streptococcus oralis]VTT08512.1 Uncharacterised protein [Streptococcus oralis]
MKIVHPVFGELTFNYGWTKRIKLNIFKKEFSVEINIDADEDAVFDENQIKAFEFFSVIFRTVLPKPRMVLLDIIIQ